MDFLLVGLQKNNTMKKYESLFIVTAIIWTGATICTTIAPENYLYIMVAGGFLSLGAIKKLGDW